MASNIVRVDYQSLLKRLENADVKTMVLIRMRAATGAKRMENYAKKYRPWTDRTGNARRTLNGYVQNISNGVRINIAHGMSYGWSLEYEHEKRYAILHPTVKALANDIISFVLDNLVKAW